MDASIGQERGAVFDRVVLDANVLYPASLRDTLLRLAERDFYRPRWSSIILEEVARGLIEDGGMDEVRCRHLLLEMKNTFADAEVNVTPELIDRLTNQAKDRHVLAAAVACDAGAIVTANLRDFPVATLMALNIDILSPDEFLTEILDFAPDAVAQLLLEQAAETSRPRLTISEVLDHLVLHAPAFVAGVRGLLR
jgi:predicted nucleic acid-binding protein